MDRSADRANGIAGFLAAIGRFLQRVPRSSAIVPVLGWAGLIWYMSSITPPPVGALGSFGGVLSNLAHAPEFGMLAMLATLLAPRRDGWPDMSRQVVTTILACVFVYAAIDEVHQGLTPHRDPSVFDVLTDTTASALVLGAITFTSGPRADPQKLVRLLLLGLFACIFCATLATVVPNMFPELEWL